MPTLSLIAAYQFLAMQELTRPDDGTEAIGLVIMAAIIVGLGVIVWRTRQRSINEYWERKHREREEEQRRRHRPDLE